MATALPIGNPKATVDLPGFGKVSRDAVLTAAVGIITILVLWRASKPSSQAAAAGVQGGYIGQSAPDAFAGFGSSSQSPGSAPSGPPVAIPILSNGGGDTSGGGGFIPVDPPLPKPVPVPVGPPIPDPGLHAIPGPVQATPTPAPAPQPEQLGFAPGSQWFDYNTGSPISGQHYSGGVLQYSEARPFDGRTLYRIRTNSGGVGSWGLVA